MSDRFLNVFEDQLFRLRCRRSNDPHEKSITRSLREILTHPDDPNETFRFDYPLEYLNVAALGLCAALVQAAFEPETVDELIERLEHSLTEAEFDAGIARLHQQFGEVFTIDGPSGTRFLQGPAPERDKKERLKHVKDLSELLLTVKRGDKQFLNRPDESWAVRLDQIPLLLFARHTFYEPSAGRGYLNGTSNDMEVRTYLVDRGDAGRLPSLRRSIWLNVLSREVQEREYKGFYEPQGVSENDRLMWTGDVSGRDDVPQGKLSLRAGLFWMVAHTYVEIEELSEPRTCIVTGDQIQAGERAGTGVAVQATGLAYGVRPEKNEKRQSFFLHPNAPYVAEEKTTGTAHKHLSPDSVAGLIGSAAGLFFGTEKEYKDGKQVYRVAPLLSQLRRISLRRRPLVDLVPYGFYMIGRPTPNVHAGYEVERFHYPSLGRKDGQEQQALAHARSLVNGFATFGGQVQRMLAAAIQRCTMVQVQMVEHVEASGRKRLEPKFKKRLGADSLARDAVRVFWDQMGDELKELLYRIDQAGSTADELAEQTTEIQYWYRRRAAYHARHIFQPFFDQHGLSPQHFVAAQEARRFLHGWLHKQTTAKDKAA